MPTTVKKQVQRNLNVMYRMVWYMLKYKYAIVSISDTSGQVISWSSAGASGFKGARKGTPFAAQTAAEAAARAGSGMRQIEVLVRGPLGRETIELYKWPV